MSQLTVLVKQQLRQRLNAVKDGSLKDDQGKLNVKKLLLFVLAAVGIFFLVGLTILLECVFFEGFKQINQPELMPQLILLLSMISTLFISFFFVMTTLYYNRDSVFLAYLPISSRQVFIAKLISILISEAGIALLLVAPASILYGVYVQADIAFYLRMVLVILLTPVIPVVIVSLIAAALTRVSGLFRHKDAMTYLGSIVLIAAVMYLQYGVMMRIPDDAGTEYIISMLMGQRSVMEQLATAFPPVLWAATGMMDGQRIDQLLLFIGTAAASVALAVLLLGKGYNAMAVQQSEAIGSTGKSKAKQTAYRQQTQTMALLKREWIEILRTPVYAMNALSAVIVVPLMMLIFSFMPQQNADFSTIIDPMMQLLTSMINPGLILLVIAGVMSLGGILNPAMTTAVTREGKRIYLSRIIPAEPKVQLKSKLLLGLSISMLSILVVGGIALFMFPKLAVLVLLAGCLSMAFDTVCCAVSLLIDVYHPRLSWRTETEAIKQSANVMISMAASLLILLVFGGGAYLLNHAGLAWPTTAIIISALILVCAFVSCQLVFRKGSVRYGAIEG